MDRQVTGLSPTAAHDGTGADLTSARIRLWSVCAADRPAQRACWQRIGESRYRPAPPHPPAIRLRNTPRRFADIHDRHDRQIVPDAHRHNAAEGRTP